MDGPNERLLLVEDNPADADLVEAHFEEGGQEVPPIDRADTVARALKLLGRRQYMAVLLDLHLPDSAGLDTLERILASGSSAPVVVLTGATGSDLGVEAVSLGAADYLLKDELTGPLLLRSIRYGVERAHRRSAERRYRALVESSRDVVSILDRAFTVRYVSPSVSRILGYRPKEIEGADSLELVHREDRSTVGRQLESVLAERVATSHFVHRVRHRNGGWCLLDTIAQNCFDDPHIGGLLLSSRDVTELRRAEDEALRSADRLERTLEALDDAVLTVETASRTIVDCNAATEAMFGYRADELVGKSVRVLHVDEASYRRLGREGYSKIAGGGSYRTEFRMRRKDGTVFPVEITLTLLRPELGLDGGAIAMTRDITGRIERERRIRFQADLLQEVGEPVLAVDEEAKVTYWNPAAEELTGWSADEVLGLAILDLIISEEDREVALFARETVKAGGRWEGEIHLRKKGGETAVVQATVTAAATPDGAPGGRIATVADITELLRAEEESRRAADRLRQQADVLAAVGQAIIVTNLEGEVVYWNRAAEELYGWSAEEALGMSVQAAAPAADGGQRATELMKALRTDQRWTGELEVRRKDGSTFPALVTGAPLRDSDGRLVGVIGVSSDLSERMALEDRLRQAEKMEAVGRLAGGVAHDFNNLLTIVEGHVTLLLEELEDDSPFREDVLEIRRAGERAAALTSQLLAFGRRQALDVHNLDLGQAVLDLGTMLRPLVPERIELRIDACPGEVVVRADSTQIEQVVMNLVVNAVDAIPDSGEIRVTVGGIVEAEKGADGASSALGSETLARLSVEDTGAGIPPEAMEHIFEPFFTTKPEGRGTGLGLATVYGIVTQSGGHVLVGSTPGRGTTFRILLPRIDAPADGPRVPVSHPSEVQGGVVLLVEDEPAVRKIADRILTRAGYTVLEASNGREALDMARESAGSVDLILSDVIMPDMGGIELHRRLQVLHPDLKMILMSGYSEAEVQGELRNIGAAFLPKPFKPEDLVQCVAETLAEGNGAASQG